MSSSSPAFWNRDVFKGSLGDGARRFWTWYKGEFFAFFPQSIVAWLLDRGDRKLVVRSDENGPGKSCMLFGPQDKSATEIALADLVAAPLTNVLARHAASREATVVILEIPESHFFVRRFDVPASVRASLPRVLTAEIERKTPFQLSDVFLGHRLKGDANGEKLHVEQWVLRKDVAERALDKTGLSIGQFDLVRPRIEGRGESDIPTIVIGRKTGTPNWFRQIAIGLGVVASVSFIAGAAITIWRQNQLDAELEFRLAEMSARATRVRHLADRAASEGALLADLRHEKENVPSFADMWEEISRLLPDGTYVGEVRLSERKPGERVVDLNGFSDSAAGLPVLFDRSPLFSEAALTSAITLDLHEKRERFSLQAKVNQASAVKPK